LRDRFKETNKKEIDMRSRTTVMMLGLVAVIGLVGMHVQAFAFEMGIRTGIAQKGGTPDTLRCEFLETPMGITKSNPALSWQIKDPQRGASQTAYQIQVASAEGLLASDTPDLWDSGKTKSEQSHLVTYQGKALLSGQRVWWRVTYWDQDGKESAWSSPSWWEMGLLNVDDWKAKWIHADLSPVNNAITEEWIKSHIGNNNPHRDKINDLYRKLEPAPRFRREFDIKGEVLSARLYISGLGYYTAWLNGTRVGDRVMAPAQTDYDRRILYDIYDVTAQLKAGKNVIGVELGDGWYNQVVPKIGFETYGKPVLRAQLEITTSTGKYLVVTGDGTWKAAAGPLLKNDLHTGEVYDARLEQPGWDSAGFDDREWSAPQTVDPLLPQGLTATDKPPVMAPQLMPPERRMRTNRAERLTQPEKGVWVFEFPENVSARLRLSVTDLPAGIPLTFRVGEQLSGKEDKTGNTGRPTRPQAAHIKPHDGEFNAMVAPGSVYVTRGDKQETWENEYTHNSFRYVELIGLPNGYTPAIDTVEQVFVHTDLPQIGSFRSSDSYLNTFVEMFRRSFYSSAHGTLQDNPGAERSGWFADSVSASVSAYYDAKTFSILRKTIHDMQTTANVRGRMWQFGPGKRPDGKAFHPGWAVPSIYVAWHVWIHSGDERILKEQYSLMSGTLDDYAQQTRDRLDDKHIWRGGGYGDWGDVNTDMIGKSSGTYPRRNQRGSNQPLNTPIPFTETAALYSGASKLAVIAAHLGHTQDAERYRELAAALREGLNSSEFYDAANKTYGSQTANAMAVLLEFALANDVPAILDWIHRDIEHWQGHFTSGFLLSYLLKALSDYGRIDDAFNIMTSPGYPGYRHMVDLGSTTSWVMWDGNTRSPDRFAVTRANGRTKGEAGMQWLYYGLAGIKHDPASPGWKHFIIQPGVPAKLDSVAAETQTPYGRIKTSWKKEKNQFMLNVTVPPNSTATVEIPHVNGVKTPAISEGTAPLAKAGGVTVVSTGEDVTVCKVQSGSYLFSYDMAK